MGILASSSPAGDSRQPSQASPAQPMITSYLSAAAPSFRMMSDYDVSLVNENPADFYIIFHGPKDSSVTAF